MKRIGTLVAVVVATIGLLVGSAPAADAATGPGAHTSGLGSSVEVDGDHLRVVHFQNDVFCQDDVRLKLLQYTFDPLLRRAHVRANTGCGPVDITWVGEGPLKADISGLFRNARASGTINGAPYTDAFFPGFYFSRIAIRTL